MTCPSTLHVNWNNIRFQITLKPDSTFGDLKQVIFKYTGLDPAVQTFPNLNLKEMHLTNDSKLELLKLESDFVVIVGAKPSLDYAGTSDGPREVLDALGQQLADLSLIGVADTADGERGRRVKVVNSPRKKKHCLVMDIDATILDNTALGDIGTQQLAARPYLHQFLAAMYEHYDIILWSATNMRFIEYKMDILGMSHNPNYKITACMDLYAMATITIPGLGKHRVKPLNMIWNRFREYNQTNTLICDDIDKNFYLNQENGIPIVPYFFNNYDTDDELRLLTRYLNYLATFPDLTLLDHTKWKQCACGE